MDYKIRIIGIIFLVFIAYIITHFVKRNKISVRYSIIWYLSILVLLIFTIFPDLLMWITNLIGIKIASNFLFVLLIGFLFVISISLTIIVSVQKEQIRTLTQEVSILKNDNRK